MHAIIYFQHLDLAAMLRHLEKFPPNALHLCQKKKEKNSLRRSIVYRILFLKFHYYEWNNIKSWNEEIQFSHKNGTRGGRTH